MDYKKLVGIKRLLVVGLLTLSVSLLIDLCLAKTELHQKWMPMSSLTGSILAFVNIYLLYKTLKSQSKAIALQQRATIQQANAWKKERTDNAFFNMLKNRNEVVGNIHAQFMYIDTAGEIKSKDVKGTEFFDFACHDILKLQEYLSSQGKPKCFDSDDFALKIHQIDEERKYVVVPEEEDYLFQKRTECIQKEYPAFVAHEYNVGKNKTTEDAMLLAFKTFHGKYGNAYNHYLRNMSALLATVEQEQSNDTVLLSYIQLVNSQMSDHEIQFLTYAMLYHTELRYYEDKLHFLYINKLKN